MNMAMSFRTSAKSLKKQRKAQRHQTGQTPKSTLLLLHHACLHFLASESSFVLEIKTKPHQLDSFQNNYLHFFKIIFTLSSTQRGFSHTCQFHLQEKTTLHMLSQREFILSILKDHLLITRSLWPQQLLPPGFPHPHP